MIGADFTLTDGERKYATDKGWPANFIDEQLEKFRNHHMAKGSTMADWSAAWRKWVNNGYDFQHSHQSTPSRSGRVHSALSGIASRISRADSAIDGMMEGLTDEDFR